MKSVKEFEDFYKFVDSVCALVIIGCNIFLELHVATQIWAWFIFPWIGVVMLKRHYFAISLIKSLLFNKVAQKDNDPHRLTRLSIKATISILWIWGIAAIGHWWIV